MKSAQYWSVFKISRPKKYKKGRNMKIVRGFFNIFRFQPRILTRSIAWGSGIDFNLHSNNIVILTM